MLFIEMNRKTGSKKVNKAPAFQQAKTAIELMTGG